MQSNGGEVCSKSSTSHRRRPLRVLFVHLDADVVEACSQELYKAQFTVKADFVLSLAQSADQLRVQPADVMIVEYPSPACKDSQVLQLIHQSVQELPIIFLTTGSGIESMAALSAGGMADLRASGERCRRASPFRKCRGCRISKRRDNYWDAALRGGPGTL
jgi:response regulator RpfG family c-di-GMP phosphodiesterase